MPTQQLDAERSEDRPSFRRQWLFVALILVAAGAIGTLGPQFTGQAGGTAAIAPADLPADKVPLRIERKSPPVSTLPVLDALVGAWPAAMSGDDIDGRFEVDRISGIEYVHGKVGTAWQSTRQSLVVMQAHPELRLERFTVAAWLKLDEKSNGGDVASVQVGPASNFVLSVADRSKKAAHGHVEFGIGGKILRGANSIADGKWHHVAATFDGREARIYIDGRVDEQDARTMRLPKRGAGVLRLAGIDGLVDEVQIHSRALSHAELRRHHRTGDWGLVRSWTGDEQHPGTFKGTIGYEKGRFGFGYTFGGHGHIEMAQSAAYDLDRFTIAAWIRCARDVSEHYAILAKENHHSGAPWTHRNYYLGVSPKWVHGDVGVTFFAPGARIGAKAPVNDGKWHHVAATYNGRELAVHLDGKQIASESMTTPPVDNRQTLWVGGFGRASQPRHAKLAIDDVALFAQALDAKALQTLANPTGDKRP